MSLVVAIFLFGLATGYFVFGKLTERNWSRFLLLKIYGYVELATAFYIIAFYLYFELLKLLSFNSANNLIVDIFIALLALFFPTFLMGASIPILTATLPNQSREVNYIHTRVYGWNIIGAFFGTLISGFYLLPNFGFKFTLIVSGLINLAASFVFIANSLKGEVKKKEDIHPIPTSLSNRFYMVFVFLTGAVVISCEILFIRLLNVSIGAGVYNFPIILSLFVGGLGLGSLSLPQNISVSFFTRQLFLSIIFLFASFLTAPYWSIWLNNIRVTLRTIPFNYYFFKLEIYLFLALFILPIAFFMGRLLPLAYASLKKKKGNYARICGLLYFFNTLGTVFGAVFIGYVAFYFLDLDRLFQINLAILLVLTGIITFFEKQITALVIIVALLCGLAFSPNWNRTGHEIGYFRNTFPLSYHFKKPFHLPERFTSRKTAFFKDGPNTTVTILEDKDNKAVSIVKQAIPAANNNYIVSLNGKVDGNFLGGDFSTTFLLSSLGYLFAPEKTSLSSALIGLGTGLSAAILGKVDDIKDVVVLEISSQLIKGLKHVSSHTYNLDLTTNPKINIIESDAFRYFNRTDKKFDIIVSEPSNPWVVGVENLFSLEFYELVHQKLTKEGVLVQWLHTYDIDPEILKMIFYTIGQVFPHSKLYFINGADVLILAGKSPFEKNDLWRERFYDPALHTLHKSLGMNEPEDIHLLEIFGIKRFSAVGLTRSEIHSLTFPKLTYESDFAFFMGSNTDIFKVQESYFFEPLASENIRSRQFQKYIGSTKDEIQERCLASRGFDFFCKYIMLNLQWHSQYRNQRLDMESRFMGYSELRKRGFIPYDGLFLEKAKKAFIKDKIQDVPMLSNYIDQVLSKKYYKKALNDISDFQSAGIFKEQEKTYNFLTNYVSQVQKVHKELFKQN